MLFEQLPAVVPPSLLGGMALQYRERNGNRFGKQLGQPTTNGRIAFSVAVSADGQVPIS
ncbi:hypothetical protein [Cupriavidus basilensis]